MNRQPVSRFMTATPITIGRGQTLAEAYTLMREHQVRHLPVVEDGHVIGVVSQRDLHLMETLQDVDLDEATVDEAMSDDPYTVAPDALLGEVARVMAERKIGSAVVVKEDGAVAGIFTSNDALRALAAD